MVRQRKSVQSIANERELFLLLSKEFSSVHVIVIDDLERMSDDIRLEELFGIIEELKQCNYVKAIVILRIQMKYNRTKKLYLISIMRKCLKEYIILQNVQRKWNGVK